MISKFHNRLTGMIVLVVLGVTVLPSLLDGQKKHYQDEFVSIPLISNSREPDNNLDILSTTMPLATLLGQQPEKTAEEEVCVIGNVAASLNHHSLLVATSSASDFYPTQ